MANMNMIIHDMEGKIEIGDTFKNPRFRNEKNGKLRTLSGTQQGGRAAIVPDTGAASRGSGNAGANKEKDARKWFVDQDLIENVLYCLMPA